MRFNFTLLFWMLGSFVTRTNAFYPNSLTSFLSYGDYTHESITELGLSQVIQELQTLSFRNFSIQHSREHVPKSSMDDIMTYINYVQKNYFSDPEWHFNNEKISEANEKLKHYRLLVLDLLRSPKPNYSAARQYLGFCLHLLHSFYSNTNWIELSGKAVYTNLGLPGKDLLPVAPTEKDTCTSCSVEDRDDGCSDNLIDIGMVLTSGYRSEIDSVDQTGNRSALRSGKCGHTKGSFSTKENRTVAKGGINKETTDPRFSPHYTRHQSAALAAIDHTVYFFLNKQNGIISEIGPQKLKLLLGLIKQETIVFVIDTSPRILPEMENLNNFIQNTLKDSSGTEYTFVLVTVGKDEYSILVQNFTTALGVRKAIMSIVFDSQPNCNKPILKAIDQVANIVPRRSQMFVFTASAPTDAIRGNDEIEAKKIVINFYVKGSCQVHPQSYRQRLHRFYRKDIRQRRSTFTVPISFTQIASSSGGQIYTGASSLTMLNIGSALDPEVTIVKMDFPGGFGGFSTLSVPADSTITKLIFKIDGISALPTSRIKDQNGNLLYAGSSGQTNITESDFGTVSVTEIIDPKPGLYYIEKIVNAYWKVEVRAFSRLDFVAQLMTSDPNSYALTEIEGRPTVGENITVKVTMSIPENVTSVSDLVLLNKKGVTLSNSKLLDYAGHKAGVYYCNVIVPSENFQIAVDGEDGKATQFRRLHTKLISPVLIKLEIHPFPNPLYTGRNFIIQYTVTNLGAGLVEALTTMKDSQQFGVSPFNKTHQLASGANVTDMFVLHGGSTAGVTTTVTVTAEPRTSGNSNFQYSVFSLTTEDPSNKTPDTTPPECNITKVIGSCSSVTNCDCNMTVVTTKLEIFDVGEGIKTITYAGSGGNSVNFTNKPFIAGLEVSQGTVIAKLVADCCRASEDITLADWTSTSTCTVPVNPSWTPGPCTTTPPPTTTAIPTTTISLTTDSLTTDSMTTGSTTSSSGTTKSQSSTGQAGSTVSSTPSPQGSTSVSQSAGGTSSTNSAGTTTTASAGSSNNSNESEGGLSTTWKIVIATSASALSVAALFTGGILLRKKFTTVSPD
uniref:Uncharacterized protein LOC111134137 n=1 Tax=Crassostrea virginica TaxID=6565 RepID=A0A8B8EG47_CRAVI|nr:uncharacterized protein LOC111134137 [Crassostrea virginica]